MSRFRIEHLAIAISQYNSILDLANYILHVKTFDNFNLVIKKGTSQLSLYRTHKKPLTELSGILLRANSNKDAMQIIAYKDEKDL